MDRSEQPNRRSVAVAHLMLAGTSLFWSGNWVLGRAMREDLSPITLNFWRWALASMILLALAGPELWRQRRALAQSWLILLALAATGVAGYHALVYFSLSKTTAINALLLLTFMPVVIAATSRVVLGERIAAMQAIGMAISACGAIVLVGQGSLATLVAFSFNEGDLWMLLSMPIWAAYSVLLRWRPQSLSGLGLVAALALTGTLLLAPFYAFEFSRHGLFPLTIGSLTTITYLALFPSVLAYIFFNSGIAVVGASRAGLFVHLMPVFGIILSMVFLGERPQTYHLVGIALVFCGLFVSTRVRATATS